MPGGTGGSTWAKGLDPRRIQTVGDRLHARGVCARQDPIVPAADWRREEWFQLQRSGNVAAETTLASQNGRPRVRRSQPDRPSKKQGPWENFAMVIKLR